MDDGYLVEIQLRTEVQHAWANMSETLAYEHDRLIKAGGGPQDLREQLERLSEQGRLIDESREMLQTASYGHQELLEFLLEREQRNPLVHELTHDVEAVLSLLGVAEYNHRRLVDGFLWETEAFEYSPMPGANLEEEN